MKSDVDIEKTDVWNEFWDRQNFNKDLIVERELKTDSFNLLSKLIKENFVNINNLKTIELGSGLGMNSLLLSLNGTKSTLLDTDEIALNKAKKLFGYYGIQPSIICDDMFRFSEKHNKDKYDLVMSFGVVEHFSGNKRLEAIKAHLNLVKKGGIVIISVPNRYCPTYQIWMNILKLFGKWNAGFEKPFSKKELNEISRALNLNNYEIKGLSFIRSLDDHLLFFLKYPIQLIIQKGSFTLPIFQVIPERRIAFIDDKIGYALWLVHKG